jgi:alkylhydroperoxidase/carboxymuconolactone decarboxylase family protein YurZ
VKAAVAAGATAAEIRETLDVCVLMGGGPAVTFSGKALELLRSLTPS